MFKRMNLRSYLLMVFSLIILLCGIIMAIGSYGLIKTRQNTNHLIEKTLASELAVKTCRIEANVAARELREMALTDPSDYSKFIADINKSMETIKQQIAIFKETHGEADGLAKRYEDSFKTWFDIASRAIKELEAGNKSKAVDIILNECSPALANMVTIVTEIDRTITQEKELQQAHTADSILMFNILLAVVFVIVLVISIWFAFRTTMEVTGVVNKVQDAVSELSKGNLKVQVDYEAGNEFGVLTEKMNFCFRELAEYVQAIDDNMMAFAEGNFAYASHVEFLGDFSHIQRAIEDFRSKMNNALSQLNEVSHQVSSGANEVEASAQALAQGATEQASSVQQLSATINDVSRQVSDTADYAQKANTLGKGAGEMVVSSQEEMKLMMQAIQDIAEASQGIQKIIKVIDDIAFQTNILALNAAVEAARAGTAGKGFAVVADEVRSLAQKSAEAAKNTTQLIENSLNHVSHGQEIVQRAHVAFDKVAEESEEVLAMIEKIAQVSQEQASSIGQISSAVDQISSVVQMNSANSVEGAAASEAMTRQAQTMKQLLNQFQLENSENT